MISDYVTHTGTHTWTVQSVFMLLWSVDLNSLPVMYFRWWERHFSHPLQSNSWCASFPQDLWKKHFSKQQPFHPSNNLIPTLSALLFFFKYLFQRQISFCFCCFRLVCKLYFLLSSRVFQPYPLRCIKRITPIHFLVLHGVFVLSRDMVHGRPDAGSGEQKQMGCVCVFSYVCAWGEQREAGLRWTGWCLEKKEGKRLVYKNIMANGLWLGTGSKWYKPSGLCSVSTYCMHACTTID